MTLNVEGAAAFLLVGGVRLEVREWPGAGAPIVLLHEGLGSVSMWRDFPAELAGATGRRVIAWSRRGHGESDLLVAPRESDYMHAEAEALPSLLDALGLDRAILFGHSDGGSIALIAAARFPERVAALVLEAPHVYVEPRSVEGIAAVKREFGATDFRARLSRHHQDVDHVFWSWNDIWRHPQFRSFNIEEMLGAVRAPLLLIQGYDDEYGTMDQLDRIQAALPNARRVELANCGHSPHRDQPDAVLEATRDFLHERA